MIKSPRNPVFLRWAGSKKQLLPSLRENMPPQFERYVEPFTGSACLFFSVQPGRAILGDINTELILTYKAVRDNPTKVARELHDLSVSRDNYYTLRSTAPDTMRKASRAARFIYLNRLCFNGLYRTNLRGEFNVPYGGTEGGQLPSVEQLRSAARILKSAELKASDFESVLESVVLGDFVYMDPPYSVKARRTFREYSSAEFGDSQLKTLRRWMCEFEKRGIPFLVSYADSDEAQALSRNFRKRHVEVRRNIAGFHGHRRKSVECLITNY